MKEYKGWEIAKMICEGTLKDGDLLTRDDWEFKIVSRHLEFMNEDNNISKEKELGTSFFTDEHSVYKIIKKPVTFMEAITSEKLIKVDVTELNEKYKNGNKVILNNYWNNVYKSIDGILEMLSQGNNHRNKIILEGKWYIKESEVDD